MYLIALIIYIVVMGLVKLAFHLWNVKEQRKEVARQHNCLTSDETINSILAYSKNELYRVKDKEVKGTYSNMHMN